MNTYIVLTAAAGIPLAKAACDTSIRNRITTGCGGLTIYILRRDEFHHTMTQLRPRKPIQLLVGFRIPIKETRDCISQSSTERATTIV